MSCVFPHHWWLSLTLKWVGATLSISPSPLYPHYIPTIFEGETTIFDGEINFLMVKPAFSMVKAFGTYPHFRMLIFPGSPSPHISQAPLRPR